MPNDLIKTLNEYTQKQAQLEVERKTLTESITDLESKLVAQYGNDWEAKYDQSVAALEEWSKKNAAI